MNRNTILRAKLISVSKNTATVFTHQQSEKIKCEFEDHLSSELLSHLHRFVELEVMASWSKDGLVIEHAVIIRLSKVCDDSISAAQELLSLAADLSPYWVGGDASEFMEKIR